MSERLVALLAAKGASTTLEGDGSLSVTGVDAKMIGELAAGQAIYTTVKGRTTLSPWTGFGLFRAYAAIALITAAVVVVRRDA